MAKKKKIQTIEPPREMCKRCREWVDDGPNDIPHCVDERSNGVFLYLSGYVDKCKKFNEGNMAKKSNKPTREQVYREIIEQEGRKWNDCKVLAFVFDGPGGPEIFHYELMYPLRPVYHLFDCFGNIAQIVVPKDLANEEMAVQLAESCGGEMTTPNLR